MVYKWFMMVAPLVVALTASGTVLGGQEDELGTAVATVATENAVSQTTGATGSTDAQPAERTPWTDYKLIAHEMGGIDGMDYTNSLDAFKQSYAAGFRVFESDLILSSDNKLVARHDWGDYLQPELPDDMKDESISDNEFLQYPIYDKFQPMDLEQIFGLMETHPDMDLVTDTKETDPDTIKLQFEAMVDTANQIDPKLLDRVIPEIYTPQMQDIVMGIHPFANEIYSIYLTDQTPEEIVQYVADQGIKVVGMQTDQVSEDFLKALVDEGVTPYIYTVNDPEEMKQDKAWGAQGFYTDFLTPADVAKSDAENA